MICNKCILPDNFPGITFSSDGICHYCSSAENEKLGDDNTELSNYESSFMEHINKLPGNIDYHCLLAYSGGKDSTYTLYLLKEKYKLNVLTYTFDNGFLSAEAKINIKTITEKLDTDNIVFSPSIELLKTLFSRAVTNEKLYSRAAIMRASAICTTCINFIRYNSLKLAVKMKIPMLIFGWAPGQIERRSTLLKPHPSFLSKSQEVFIKANSEVFSSSWTRYFLSPEEFKESSNDIPHFINPLLFNEYDMNKIKSVINSLGWKNPNDIDANSTNCLLNTLGNKIHHVHYGYNPYVQEVSELVRDGFISREEGLQRMEKNLNSSVIGHCMEKLCLPESVLEGKYAD